MKDVFSIKEAIQKIEFFCSYQERCHEEVVLLLPFAILTSIISPETTPTGLGIVRFVFTDVAVVAVPHIAICE